jgi:SAM-dependent methyltransferase
MLLNRLSVRLFVLSVWMLFLELFIIRWISTEIRIFAYVSNLALLACFTGIGLGCFFSRKRRISCFYSFVFMAVLIVSAQSNIFREITGLLSGFSDSVIWYAGVHTDKIVKALEGMALTTFLFVVILGVFFPLGQLMGDMFENHKKTIAAYSINVTASIVGIWLFGLLSFLSVAPPVWFIVSACLGFVFIEKKILNVVLFAVFAFLSLIVMLVPSEKAIFSIWSPYQKLSVYPSFADGVHNGYQVMVNNVSYMSAVDISEQFVGKHFPGSQVEKRRRLNQYELPYMFRKDVRSALIVGAGGGNDVAGALRQGVNEIDAVEIDPVVYRIGKVLHPEKPYDDKRVRISVDDARSFFKKTKKQYDVISFGLLDAHTTSSSYNNIRLDHYVYTAESIREAKKLLKPDGIMVLSFQPAALWMPARLYCILEQAFKKDVLLFQLGAADKRTGYGGIMYVATLDELKLADTLNSNPELRDYVEANRIVLKSETDPVKVATDDWPYLYVEKPSIPTMYLFVILSLVAVLGIGAKFVFSKSGGINWHFFFLGAAFLLLEFQNISKSALLFGSTWLVNAYMITAILLLILLANLFTAYFKPRNIKPFYYLLWMSILAIYIVPLTDLNIANHYLKATLVACFMNVPIFFAGVIFIHSFSEYPQKDKALGSNLLGACAGGLLESLSFIFGIKALLLIVLGFYLLSFVFRGKMSPVRP